MVELFEDCFQMGQENREVHLVFVVLVVGNIVSRFHLDVIFFHHVSGFLTFKLHCQMGNEIIINFSSSCDYEVTILS